MADILALLAGKPSKAPGKDKGEGMGMSKDMPMSEGPEKSYAREAFSAIKDDDEDGFVQAFIGAVRACAKSYSSEPDDDEAA